MPTRKAFSLLEVLLALALGALLMGLSVINLWPARNSASSRSLADSLAEELRLAQRSALATGVPVAVALPTQGGGPHCQSLYTLTGQQKPQIGRVRNFAQEFAGTYLCVGTWGRSGPGSWGRTQPKPMSNSDAFDPAAWVNPVNPLDPTLIFTPAGTVTSNGLPLWNGEFYLVASNGVQFQPDVVPGSGPALNYFSLNRLSKPWTLRVSASGAITLAPGLIGSDGSTTLDQRSFITSNPPAPPPASLPANTAPTITACQVSPQPPDGSAAGVAVLSPDEHLSLRVTASDAQGDRLYCKWTASGGTFSSSIQDRMELAGNQWVSHWEWRPPAGIQSGSYTLTCTVTDQRGASTTGGSQGSVAVTLEASPSIVFGDSSTSLIPSKLKRIHLNGTGETEITTPQSGIWGDLKVSPNGDKFLYSFVAYLFSCNADGTGATWLSVNPVGPEWVLYLGGYIYGQPCFSPAGTQMVFSGLSMLPVELPSVDLFLCNISGGTITRFTHNDSLTESLPLWSGDGQLIVFESSDAGSNTEIHFKLLSGGPSVSLSSALAGSQTPVDLCPTLIGGRYRLLYRDLEQTQQFRVMDFDASGVTTPVGTLNPSLGAFRSGHISIDGSKVTYVNAGDIYVGNADGSGIVNLTNGPAGFVNDNPIFTPDGSQVVFFRIDPSGSPFRGDLYRARVDGSSLGRITRGSQILNKSLPYSGWDLVP